MPRAPPTEPWTDEHTLALLRSLVSLTLTSRAHLYALPALATQSGNGGDRINKHLLALLRATAVGTGVDGAEGVVSEAIATGRKRKAEVVKAGKADKPRNKAPKAPKRPAKGKQQVKLEVKEEEEEEVDELENEEE
ncbi:hypothetical protein Q5752_003644 [Cryptotrichosporon argae]